MSKPRLFVFGDSWAFNYFSKESMINSTLNIPNWPVPHFGSECIKGYSIKYNYFGHWIDHMEFFYDVYSYAIPASPNEQIIYQIGNLPKYKDGDRIIVIFAPPERFTWVRDNRVKGLVPHAEYFETIFKKEFADIIKNQFIDRYDVWVKDEETNEQKFLKLLPLFLSNYKPIFTSWYKPTSDKLDFIKYINHDKFETINDETNGKCRDYHLGVRGNYKLFKFFAKELGLDVKDYKYDIREPIKLL